MNVTCHSWTAGDPLRPPRGHSQPLWSASWLAVPVLSGLLLAACGGSLGGSSASPTASAATPAATGQQTTRSTAPALSSVFGHPLLSPQVTVTPGGVYVAWQVSPPGSAAVRSELTRIYAATGRIQAWRYQVLAVAGGGLGVAEGNRLLRLSLPAAGVAGWVMVPGAASSDLSANAAGTVLVVGEADSGGRGAVQRRDPATGAILASHPVMGVTAPAVAGSIDSA